MSCAWPGPATSSPGSERKKGRSPRRPSCWSAWWPSIASINCRNSKKTRAGWRRCGSAPPLTPALSPWGEGRVRGEQCHHMSLSREEARRHLREKRRSLVVAACVAGLVIMAAVQYLSTREPGAGEIRSEEHTSELQSRLHLVCRLLLEKKKQRTYTPHDRSPGS